MAFTATNVKELKPSRGARQQDTIGERFSKTFAFTIPAGSTATTSELTKIKLPANLAIEAVWVKADAASTANSTVALSTTTAGKVFANAAALTTAWAKRTGANDTTVYTSSGDDTITATIGTATEANAVNVTCTILGTVVDAASTAFDTFTI